MLLLTGSAGAQRVDGLPNRAATAPVNLQLTPTDAFIRIRGWSLPAPILPLSIMGGWGGRGTISGAGEVNVPVGQISSPSQFQFPRDINGEEETMTVSLTPRGDWTGNVNPLNGEATMHMPASLRIQASHVRMVNPPWPIGWIYGNIDCTVPLDFGPMTTAAMEPPDPTADPAPVTTGTPYSPESGQFSVINNAMTIGGFDCSRPDIGSGQVEDELNGAVAIPSPSGRTDARFNLTFLEGGGIIRPRPAIRPAFGSLPGAPLDVAFDAAQSFAKAGVLRYAWDFDGDGTVDEAGAEPSITHSFPTAGARKVGLRVVDRDGDVSPWAIQDVTASTRPGAGVARLGRFKISPKKRRAAPGSTVKFRVRLRNSGLAPASGVKICVTGPKKLLKTEKRCMRLGDLGPGEARSRRVKVRLSAKARGRRTVALRIKATARSVQPVKARALIRVTGARGRR